MNSPGQSNCTWYALKFDVLNFLGFVQLGCIVILLRRCL